VKIKILGISASPRSKGNTEYLLEEALKGARSCQLAEIEIEKYSTAGKKYLPCTACFACSKLNGYCIQEKNDDFGELRDKWLMADGIILASPVYHMGIPGHFKSFIDRLGNSLGFRYPKIGKHLKVYGIISQGCHIFAGQEHVVTQLINHALVMGNVVISGDMWESYTGGCGWTEGSVQRDSLARLYTMKKSTDAQITVKACYSLGKRVAELATIIKAGVIKYIDYLEKDETYKPLVDRIRQSIK